MIASIGDLIVKACLLFGVVVLGIGSGVATYGGIYLAKDRLQSKPPSMLKSEFKESWETPKPTPRLTPTPALSPKPAVKGVQLSPQTVVSSPQVTKKLAVYLSYSGKTIYCPEENVQAVRDISKKISELYESEANYQSGCFKNCENSIVLQNCYDQCSAQHKEDYNACFYAYYDLENNPEDLETCKRQADQILETCDDNCLDHFKRCIEDCKPNYSQIDFLDSQINSLCP